MNSQASEVGVLVWTAPFALLGVLVGFHLAGRHLPFAAPMGENTTTTQSAQRGQDNRSPALRAPVSPTFRKTTPDPRPVPQTTFAPPPQAALREQNNQPPILPDPVHARPGKSFPELQLRPRTTLTPPRRPLVTAPSARSVVQENPFDHNYALAANGATVQGGIHPERLIDGKHAPYDGSSGYAYTTWKSKKQQFFDVTLKEPVTLNVVRFLLWDKSARFYRYKLEASAEPSGETWFMLTDRSREPMECRGWQVIVFRPCLVTRLRLTGTYNSANSSFHVVELEAYHVPGGLEYPWIELEF